MSHDAPRCVNIASEAILGREIPEEVAARTDRENEFPSDMWRKLGEAGYGASNAFKLHRS